MVFHEFAFLIQIAGSFSGRRRSDAHALATAGDRSGDLPMSVGIQRHVLPGSQHRLLQVVQEHHRHVYHRDRSCWTSQALPVQRAIRDVRQGDGILLGKHYSNIFLQVYTIRGDDSATGSMLRDKCIRI